MFNFLLICCYRLRGLVGFGGFVALCFSLVLGLLYFS